MNFDQHSVCPDCSQDPCVCGKPKFHPNDPKGSAGSKKPPIGLVPSAALEEAAWVLKFGAEQYGRYNWRDTKVLATTYINATFRHLMAWRDGEDIDPGSGRSHLGHIIANAAILLDAMQHGTVEDDRYKKP